MAGPSSVRIRAALAADPGSTPGLAARGLSWEVLAGNSLACGHAVWLRVAPSAEELTTPSRVAALRLEETGHVPFARIGNPSELPMLLTGQLVVRGGLQTRVVERSVIVPASSVIDVPVRCVESGRWEPRDGEPDRFEVSEPVSIHMKRRLTQVKAESMRATGDWSVDQRSVWNEVDSELTRTQAPSHTRSYEAYLDGARKRQVEALARQPVRPADGANAILLRPRRGGFWLEIFPSHDALLEQAQSLLADLAEPDPEPWSSAGAVPNVEELLDRIWSVGLRAIDAVPGSIGESFALAESDASGEVLLVAGRIAHAAIGASVARG